MAGRSYLQREGAKEYILLSFYRGQWLPSYVLCAGCGINLPCLIKVKVKVKFTLVQAKKIQRGSRGIAPLFL
jgi:hypothetical protein